jgi:hypothetical protein
MLCHFNRVLFVIVLVVLFLVTHFVGLVCNYLSINACSHSNVKKLAILLDLPSVLSRLEALSRIQGQSPTTVRPQTTPVAVHQIQTPIPAPLTTQSSSTTPAACQVHAPNATPLRTQSRVLVEQDVPSIGESNTSSMFDENERFLVLQVYAFK